MLRLRRASSARTEVSGPFGLMFRLAPFALMLRLVPFALSHLSLAAGEARRGAETVWGFGVMWDAALAKTDDALVLWARCLSLVLGYVDDTGEPWRRHPA